MSEIIKLKELRKLGNLILPGGIPVYTDIEKKGKKIIDTAVFLVQFLHSNPKAKEMFIDLREVQAFGVLLQKVPDGWAFAYVYPVQPLSLDTYVGYVFQHQMVFKTIAERKILDSGVYVVTKPVRLNGKGTQSIGVRNVFTGAEETISVQNHVIADPDTLTKFNVSKLARVSVVAETVPPKAPTPPPAPPKLPTPPPAPPKLPTPPPAPPKPPTPPPPTPKVATPTPSSKSFPPPELYITLPPSHIAAQHTGECAADAFQTDIFFADGFREFFAYRANEAYKTFIKTQPRALFDINHPTLRTFVRDTFQLRPTAKLQGDDFEALEYVFTAMIRRYILIRLLDFGDDTEIQSLRIEQTACIFPGKEKEVSRIPGRRPSLNVLTSIDIYDRMVRKLLKHRENLNPNLTFSSGGLGILHVFQFMCILFDAIHVPNPFQVLLMESTKPPSVPLEKVVAFGLALKSKKSGHAVSLFLQNNRWYLQDDNLGFAKNIHARFNPVEYYTLNGRIVILNYNEIPKKGDLIEQKLLSKEEFQSIDDSASTFYAYKYLTKEGQEKFKYLLYIPERMYSGSMIELASRLVYLKTPATEEESKDLQGFCSKTTYGLRNNVQELVSKPSTDGKKKVPTLTSYKEETLEQLEFPFESGKVTTTTAARVYQVKAPSVNMMSQIQAFEQTGPTTAAVEQRRAYKLKNQTANLVKEQFTAF